MIKQKRRKHQESRGGYGGGEGGAREEERRYERGEKKQTGVAITTEDEIKERRIEGRRQKTEERLKETGIWERRGG